jgi:hypothetical protein
MPAAPFRTEVRCTDRHKTIRRQKLDHACARRKLVEGQRPLEKTIARLFKSPGTSDLPHRVIARPSCVTDSAAQFEQTIQYSSIRFPGQY